MSDDPFVELGLSRDASLDEVRAARRRLAFEFHPDRGGDAASMQRVNAAFDAAVAHITGRRRLPELPSTPGSDASRMQSRSTSADATRGRAQRDPPPVRWGKQRHRFEQDAPSFTVDALPVEAFEALLVVAAWIGEVLDDDPPYVLECHLHEPAPCWCRLDLVPDAGGSTVSITVAAPAGEELPSTDPSSTDPSFFDVSFVERVRDVWVEQLNQLGPLQP